MIKIQRPQITDPEGLHLVQRAGVARQVLIDTFNLRKKLEVDDRIYRLFKSYIFRASHQKCAYCESKIASQPGDVEHFRPKNRVVDDTFKPIRVTYPGSADQADHMGYFWLAYDYENLLPSCADCNRFRHYEDGGSGGKADKFPVKGQHKFLPNDDLESEQPLLVDPAQEDPNLHFDFLESGLMKARTERGETTLRLFALNLREPLVLERRRAYAAAWNNLGEFLSEARRGPSGRVDFLRDEVNHTYRGETAYSAFGRLALQQMIDAYSAQGVALSLPLPTPRVPPVPEAPI